MAWNYFSTTTILQRRRRGVQIESAIAEKYARNPVLSAQHPWEQGYIGYPTLVQDGDEKIYKMWYEVRDPKTDWGRLLYAVSKDGLTWEKPELNTHEFEKSRKNNIVFVGSGKQKVKAYAVIKDYSDSDPGKRYKMMHHLWDFRGRGITVTHSPDGIQWTVPTFLNLTGGFDTHNVFFFDDRLGHYVGYFRHFVMGRRSISRSISYDGYHWANPVLIHQPDAQDPPDLTLYTPSIFKHSKANNVYILYTAVIDHSTDLVHVQLGVSRDGIDWHRFRKPFLSLGEKGEWDSGVMYAAPSEVSIGDRTAVYFQGNNIGHGFGGQPGIGVAFLPEFSFVGLRAAGEGTIVTQPLRLFYDDNDRAICLIADAAGGSIQAEVLDAKGGVISGFSRELSRPVTGKGSLLALEWNTKTPPNQAFRKGPIRLKLYLNKATVYGLGARRLPRLPKAAIGQ